MTSNQEKVQVWQGRSHISIFVHNLHLLDLDQDEDWPGVTVHTYGPKSKLQCRVRCTEWSLYRLFCLYDARATRDKLSPFFPPATSLQSVNLRAALLRQLTDLKKDGVLAHHIILRKTMLDECKGDKFEELLAAFSVVLLKKTLKLNLNLAVKNDNLLPLILSHRKGIQRDLEDRRELDLKAGQQLRNIDTSIESLSKEAALLSKKSQLDVPENAEALKTILRENWIGEYAWIDTILHGVPATRVKVQNGSYDTTPRQGPSRLLTDLEANIKSQNARLVELQAYLNDLKQDPCSKTPVESHLNLQSQDRPSRFTRHKKLILDPAQKEIESLTTGMRPHHAALLEALDREMSSSNALPPEPVPVRAQAAKLLVPVAGCIDTPQRTTTPPVAASILAARADSYSSAASSQRNVVEDTGNSSESKDIYTSHTLDGHKDIQISPQQGHPVAGIIKPTVDSEDRPPELSLLERTRASLAHYETPKTPFFQGRQSTNHARESVASASATTQKKLQSDRASLLERTCQSMSMLTNALDDSFQGHSTRHPRKPMHSRSKTTVNITTQRPRLERAWSEESLASIATKEDAFDVEADYDSVFKSRPRLATSPNLSPQRTGGDLWLESQLEEGMNKLTIDSSPDL